MGTKPPRRKSLSAGGAKPPSRTLGQSLQDENPFQRVGQCLQGKTAHFKDSIDAVLHPVADATSSESSTYFSPSAASLATVASSTSGFCLSSSCGVRNRASVGSAKRSRNQRFNSYIHAVGGAMVLSQLTGEAARPKPAVGSKPPPWHPPSIGSAAKSIHRRIQSIGWGSRLAFNQLTGVPRRPQTIHWAIDWAAAGHRPID